MSKCSSKAFCETLKSKIQPGPTSAKGIVGVQLINMQTLERTRYLVAYQSGPKDRGLVLNYCPWCGGSLKARQKMRKKEPRP